MTITEAVVSMCSIEVPSNTVDLEIINGGLNGGDQYSAPLASSIARISCNVLAGILPLASFKEGDLTITINTAGVRARLEWLANKYGFDDILAVGKPTVRDKSYVW